MQQKKVDVWVGLFVVFGALCLIALALRVGGGGLFAPEAYEIKANFTNVGALKPHAPIKMSGVVIGSVNNVDLVNVDGEYKAQVSLLIHEGIKIPRDSGVAVNTAGLLGAQFVSITQGAQIDQPIAAGGLLENTQSAMVLEDLITQFGIGKAEAASKEAETPAAP